MAAELLDFTHHSFSCDCCRVSQTDSWLESRVWSRHWSLSNNGRVSLVRRYYESWNGWGQVLYLLRWYIFPCSVFVCQILAQSKDELLLRNADDHCDVTYNLFKVVVKYTATFNSCWYMGISMPQVLEFNRIHPTAHKPTGMDLLCGRKWMW
jgi:hypothetical protein